MTENPDYWNTIATVIPVIALTYATALKRRDWHKLKPMTRRWISLYGAAAVALLAWAEWISLRHLQEKSTTALDEGLTLLLVGVVTMQVLAVPVAPLIVLAIHDLHPKVIRAKRMVKSDTRDLAKVRKEFRGVIRYVERQSDEYRIEGMEQVLREPGLVYGPDGYVIPGYRDRVKGWHSRGELLDEVGPKRERVEEKMRFIEKRVKRSQRRLAKALKSLTKRAAKLTDLHG